MTAGPSPTCSARFCRREFFGRQPGARRGEGEHVVRRHRPRQRITLQDMAAEAAQQFMAADPAVQRQGLEQQAGLLKSQLAFIEKRLAELAAGDSQG